MRTVKRRSFRRQVQAARTLRIAGQEPVPRLPRPLLLIQGARNTEASFTDMRGYLTREGNNGFGGAYAIEAEPEFLENYRKNGGNIFTMVFTGIMKPLEEDGREIGKAVRCIREITGSDKVDVVAECKGALGFREYIRQDGSHLGHVILLVPPNQGFTPAADLGYWIARTQRFFHLPFRKLNGYPVTRETLQVFKTIRTNVKIGPWKRNKVLYRLNQPENLARERGKTESITVITGAGFRFLQGLAGPGFPIPGFKGDQWIPVWSAKLPHADNYLVYGEGGKHRNVKKNPVVFAKIVQILTGKPMPPELEREIKLDAPARQEPGAAQIPRSALLALSGTALLPLSAAAAQVSLGMETLLAGVGLILMGWLGEKLGRIAVRAQVRQA